MTETPIRIAAVGESMLELAPTGDGTYRFGYAGDTFNTIWHMAQLLGPRARAGFVTRIGTDKLSDRFAAEMDADGLDLSGIGRDADRTMGLYLIELEGAERSFHYWRQDSAARRLADDPAWLASVLSSNRLIHVSGITLAILSPAAREALYTAIDAARKGGARVSFDPNIRPLLWSSASETRQAVERMLSRTDIALPSFDDEHALWNDGTPAATVARLRGLGVAELAVKDGAGPVHFSAAGVDGACDTPPVSEIRDTTGAGDAFNAGYLAARLTGAEPRQAIAAGQALASVVLASQGARAPRDVVRRLAAETRT